MKIIPYLDRDNAFVTVAHMREPYGPGTEDVVSIGSTLKGKVENPTWKVHIPTSLLPQLYERMVIDLHSRG